MLPNRRRCGRSAPTISTVKNFSPAFVLLLYFYKILQPLYKFRRGRRTAYIQQKSPGIVEEFAKAFLFLSECRYFLSTKGYPSFLLIICKKTAGGSILYTCNKYKYLLSLFLLLHSFHFLPSPLSLPHSLPSLATLFSPSLSLAVPFPFLPLFYPPFLNVSHFSPLPSSIRKKTTHLKRVTHPQLPTPSIVTCNNITSEKKNTGKRERNRFVSLISSISGIVLSTRKYEKYFNITA